MDTNSSGKKGNEDFKKQVMRQMKYSNLNSKINVTQINRFKKLFSNEKEPYMFLLLRIMNAFSLYVYTNEQLYNWDNGFRSFILSYIFDPIFILDITQNTTQGNYIDNICYSFEEEDENDIELVDNEEKHLPEEKISNYTYDKISFLSDFFDLHFDRLGDSIYFKIFYSFSNNVFFSEDNYKEYSTFLISKGTPNYVPYSGKYFKLVCIDEKFKNFIDHIFNSNIPSNYTFNIQKSFLNFKNQYWTSQRKKIFFNYLHNLRVEAVFQYDSYQKCTVHFNKIFYEWSVDNLSKETLI